MVQAPDGSVGSGNTPGGAHFCALYPAVATARRWVAKEDHELVEIGFAFLPRRLIKAEQERVRTRNRARRRLSNSFHERDFTAFRKKAVALERQQSVYRLKSAPAWCTNRLDRICRRLSGGLPRLLDLP